MDALNLKNELKISFFDGLFAIFGFSNSKFGKLRKAVEKIDNVDCDRENLQSDFEHIANDIRGAYDKCVNTIDR